MNKASSADAQLIVQALRERHPAAAHACWALLAGGQSAANNNGEPGGTAGRPMLDVLRQQELEGVLATVVRHFGGIRRGAGGAGDWCWLPDAVAQALAGADMVVRVRQLRWICQVPHALAGWARHGLELGQTVLLEAVHGNVVAISLRVCETQAAALRARLD